MLPLRSPFRAFCFAEDARACCAAACSAITSTWGSRWVDGRLLLLSPMDFFAGDLAGEGALLVAGPAAGLDALEFEDAADVLDFKLDLVVPVAAGGPFIAFRMPVAAPVAFEVLGFATEVAAPLLAFCLPTLPTLLLDAATFPFVRTSFFAGALFLGSGFAAALVATGATPLFFDAVAMEVSVGLAGMTLAKSSRTLHPPCRR